MIFPTHRVFEAEPDGSLPIEDRLADPEGALHALEQLPRDRAAAVVYKNGDAELAIDGEGELDVRLVDRPGHEGDSHTPNRKDPVPAVGVGQGALGGRDPAHP